MTTITLPPDLERRIVDEASRRGTTPELLALDGLRQLFVPPPVTAEVPQGGTLYDFLAGHIGTIEGTTEPLSQDCGKRFAQGMVEKRQRGRL